MSVTHQFALSHSRPSLSWLCGSFTVYLLFLCVSWGCLAHTRRPLTMYFVSVSVDGKDGDLAPALLYGVFVHTPHYSSSFFSKYTPPSLPLSLSPTHCVSG
ncbi:hypothetical protein BDP55DRAFT_670255 [Colletotrichum godetiae]|uniref:Uncharacterized protein n=1 Tax=Colletotrichum godetiae TaxID=1209918 RepID=A0AAJ0AGG3_9PEZI|nr:uncharacterized protein BDP55DRAFT_670255 [Colletotrichum godetiae]KAK1673455.1 hypothetical protein BDP55DRAFT_670255 [Colletotrichum godetiae]